MAASFPTSLKTFTDLSSTTKMDDTGLEGDTVINEIHDEVEALQTKVGADSSAVATSIDYKLTSTSSSNPGHKHTLANGATDITASAAEINKLDDLDTTKTELGYVHDVTSAIQTQLNAKAPLASPTFTGTVTMPTGLTGLAKMTSGVVSAVTAPSGTVVGTTDTQTLTNKTITPKCLINTVVSYTPDASATATLDIATGNIHSITMPAGNITIAISNEVAGQCFLVEITQDGGGSRTVTWFSTIKWAGGVAPTLTTTASKRDVFGFRVTGTDTYDGFIVGLNI